MIPRRFLLLLLTACTFLAAQAQSPNLAGIAHVALRVHDLAASIAFYEKLGFVKAFDLSRNGQVYEAFIKINDHQFIELYPVDEKNPQIGFLHVCFEGNDLQSVHDFYVAHGLTPNAVRTAGAGNLLFTVPGPITPQGPQNLEYTQYMPGSLHSKDFGQHLGKDRRATHLVSVQVIAIEPAAAQTFYTDKLLFTPSKDQKEHFAYVIPGSPTQTIRLFPGDKNDQHASLVLADDDPPARVANHAGSAVQVGMDLLKDPDGNDILLRHHTVIR